MKKHTEALAKITSEKLDEYIASLRKDINDLKRGVRMGDVQNYKMITIKKRDLARALSRQAQEKGGNQ